MSDDIEARLAELEGLDEDMFDFPDINGMADLLAASRADAAEGPAPSAPKAAPQEPATAPRAAAPTSAPKPAPAAPLPSTPRNEADLDEDLFSFGELLDLGTAPGFGQEDPLLDADPLADLAAEPWAETAPPAAPKGSAPPAAPAPAPVVEAESAPAPAPASEAPAPEQARKAKNKKTEAKPTVVVREKKKPEPEAVEAAAAPATAPSNELDALAGSGNPFISFPNAIDLPPARSKMLWVLVGCFLLVNGGIFLLTQQQNQSVNRTLLSVTSTLADAVARGANAAPRSAVIEDEPREVNEPARASVPLLDPRDYTNTHELAILTARQMIEHGEYAEARRSLFTVLANQDRGAVLTVEMREDIDYLIAMTYYDQGRSIAPEESR